jgi:hypothetical protein
MGARGLAGDNSPQRTGLQLGGDTVSGESRRRRAPRRAAVVAVYALTAVVLFLVYLRLAVTAQEDSDMANILFMASGLLHGNLLLHGWHTSDVSFYTTELPQYALLESLLGSGWRTAHVAAAMTYTLTFLLAVALARGGASGRRAVIATLIAGGILLAPEGNNSVFALLVAVGHIGTAVPLLLTFLLLDRAGRRWWAAPGAGVLLAWALVADPLVLVAGVLPIGLIAAGRFLVGLRRRQFHRHELALMLAMAVAPAAAWAAERVLAALGGYVEAPYTSTLQPFSMLRANAQSVLGSLLALFGADSGGQHGPALWFSLLHLASIALIIVAVLMVSRRFFGGAGLVDQALLVAIACIAGGAVLTIAARNGAHEIAPIEPLAAALTARMLAGGMRSEMITGRRWSTPRSAAARRVAASAALAGVLLLAGYVAALGFAASRPERLPQYSELAGWLAAHHLHDGLADYWEAGSVTADSGGVVRSARCCPSPARTCGWPTRRGMTPRRTMPTSSSSTSTSTTRASGPSASSSTSSVGQRGSTTRER